jgi:hypothetical protein
VALQILLVKIHAQLLPWIKVAKRFCNFHKTAQSNNDPIGENSPNLVTLSLENLVKFLNQNKQEKIEMVT